MTQKKISASQVSIKVGDLANVVGGSTATNGQVLKFDQAQNAWIPGSGGGGAIRALSDVQIFYEPAENDILQYNGYKWINKPISQLGVSQALANLTDTVFFYPPAYGHLLYFNGNNWTSGTPAQVGISPGAQYLSDLQDTTIDSPQDGYVLKYRTQYNSWVAEPSETPPASGADSFTNSETAPTSPALGARWYVPSVAKLFTRINDGTSDQWVEL